MRQVDAQGQTNSRDDANDRCDRIIMVVEVAVKVLAHLGRKDVPMTCQGRYIAGLIYTVCAKLLTPHRIDIE